MLKIDSTVVLPLLVLFFAKSVIAATGPNRVVRTAESPKIRCLDSLEDWNENWGASGSWSYSPNSGQLPGVLAGKLEEDGSEGIFWYEGSDEDRFFYLFSFDHPYDAPYPIYMYIKYYSHLATNSSQSTYVTPAEGFPSGEKQLEKTTDFLWREELTKMGFRTLSAFSVHASYFNVGDYFLLEKVIVTEGYEISGITDMLSLCGYPEPSTTFTTELTTVTVTTEDTEATTFETTTPPSWGGICTEPGTFPDPHDCTKFHVCQLNEVGDLWDTVFTCPVTTVWCQRTLTCESPDFCPCDLDL